LWDPTGQTIPAPPGGAKSPYSNKKFLAASSSSSVGDVPYMRAAEMYLIEAEAKARLGQSGPAAEVLYTLVSNRNPAYIKSSNTGQALIDEILIQRRVELWGEGFRFLDLKRTDSALDRRGTNHNESLTGGLMLVPAGDKRWQFLIPQNELNANSLVAQNPL
jgi:starch-binding outer membrane protein, SusD/RagB family